MFPITINNVQELGAAFSAHFLSTTATAMRLGLAPSHATYHLSKVSPPVYVHGKAYWPREVVEQVAVARYGVKL
jgi:hypothetical protein